MSSQTSTRIIYNASQVLTLSGGPQRGENLGDLNILYDGAVAMQGEDIIEVGPSQTLREKYPRANGFDAGGCVLLPGFVDPHSHLVWAGDRAAEFEMRLQGKTYMEIMAAGGGILSTVKTTRSASFEELLHQSRKRAQLAFSFGTTTMEVKTGYGLTFDSELKQLRAILALNEEGPIELIPTFMPAHTIPPEYNGKAQDYVHLICDKMLPECHGWWQTHQVGSPLPFVDVFCEQGVFDLNQSRQILETARDLGFPLKIHADEFENLGGAALAAELGAASADHLVKTSMADIRTLAASDTVAVSLPGTPFGLNQEEYTPAQALIEADALFGLATDTNPGTSWCESMQFILALACRKMGLTPAQAIAASTINAAAALELDGRLGSLEPGKQADMLILDVDDYRQLGYRYGINLVAYVVKRGRIYPVR